MYIFIDESGDHNLRPEGLDNLYNVFVLGAFCIEESDYSDFETRFNAMKTSLFWGDDFIIHTAEITRPNRSLDERNKLLTMRIYGNDFIIQYMRSSKKRHFTSFRAS